MNRPMPFVLGLVLAMSLASGSMPANAACSGARAVTSATDALTFFYTPGHPFTPSAAYPVTPYGGSMTYYLNGVFWSWGGGDPTYGLGNDSGYFKGYAFILTSFYGVPGWLGGGYYTGFGAFLGGPYGHWQTFGVDGCIDFDGSDSSALDPNECNVVLLTDEADQTGYFAALSVGPTAGGDFEYTENTGFAQAVTLAPIPKPYILSTSTAGTTMNVEVIVDPGTITPANGFHFACHEDEILVGYKIYARAAPLGTPEPNQIQTRAVNQIFGPPLDPWIPLTPEIPIGAHTQFSLEFPSGPMYYYLCATLVFGGVAPGAPNYELKSCSMSKLVMGPILAHPEEGRGLDDRIDRSSRRPGRRTGTRSGR